MSNIFDLFAKISDGRTSAPKKPIGWIIAGLGNPGREYERTRHNTGFIAMTALARRTGAEVTRARFHALTGECELSGQGVLLMLPQTFMNASGIALREAAAFYKIPPERVLVLVDDINLDVGRLRARRDGSAGGHNGLKSIIEQLGTDKFPRIRIGVGQKPHPDMELMDWVLSRFTDSELEKIKAAAEIAAEGSEKVVTGDFEAAMRHCNGK